MRALSEEEQLERAIVNKRRRIRMLEREITALEELVEVLRKTEEVKVHAQQR